MDRAESMRQNRVDGTPKWSYEAIMRLIWDMREQTGSCSLARLARIMEQDKRTVHLRLKTMRRLGMVTWNEGAHGSIRCTSETIYRKTD